MATQTYSDTEPLSDTTASHIEMARQRAHAAVMQQAYRQLAAGVTASVTIGETVVLPTAPAAGKKGVGKAGSITRTATVTI